MGCGGRTGFHKKNIDVQVGGGGTGYNPRGPPLLQRLLFRKAVVGKIDFLLIFDGAATAAGRRLRRHTDGFAPLD